VVFFVGRSTFSLDGVSRSTRAWLRRARQEQPWSSKPLDEAPDRARLAGVEAELENLVRLAARLGNLGAYERVVEELRQEQRAIEQRLHCGATPIEVSPHRLQELVAERELDLRRAFEGEPEGVRAALRELLGQRRMCVGPDPERGSRVEGVFEWTL
jgi:hypothetical protein